MRLPPFLMHDVEFSCGFAQRMLGSCGQVTTHSLTVASSSLTASPPFPSLLLPWDCTTTTTTTKEFALSFELRFYFPETVGRGSLPSS